LVRTIETPVPEFVTLAIALFEFFCATQAAVHAVAVAASRPENSSSNFETAGDDGGTRIHTPSPAELLVEFVTLKLQILEVNCRFL
jgi:hypothetical protein